MRSHRRRQPIEHVLIAGGVDDFDAIAEIAANLPAHAYGQILIESTGAMAPLFDVPARVTVQTISAPVTEAGHDGTAVLAARSTSLASVVNTWLGEWLPAEPDADRSFSLWLGGKSDAEMNLLAEFLPVDATRI